MFYCSFSCAEKRAAKLTNTRTLDHTWQNTFFGRLLQNDSSSSHMLLFFNALDRHEQIRVDVQNIFVKVERIISTDPVLTSTSLSLTLREHLTAADRPPVHHVLLLGLSKILKLARRCHSSEAPCLQSSCPFFFSDAAGWNFSLSILSRLRG